MASPFRPETDLQLLEQFAVEPGECARLLAELAESSETVTLYPHGAPDCAVVSRILSVDPSGRGVELAFSADAARQSVFREAGAVTVVAVPARVKLQFELEHLALDHPPLRLRGAVAGRLSRLQRRDAYRVVPPVAGQARLWLRDPQSITGERRVTLLDVSVTGVGFGLDGPPAAVPDSGDVLPGCRLELPANVPIRCDLVVRTVEPVPAQEDGTQLRVGCAFAVLDPQAARVLQIYVNTAQTLGRRLRPKLG
jgi:c-di-GMP-binding flagellar brake protein YcgR